METWAQEQQRLPNQSKLADIDISALSLYTPSVGSGDTLDDCKMSIKQPNSAFDSENGIERDLEEVVFCGRSGWYMRWSDGSAAWDHIPTTLHQKLCNRNKSLPGVVNMAISMDNSWLVLFKDGSFANSGFPITPKLEDSLFDDSPPVLFTFAPAGGWVLMRQDGTLSWDKLPTSLNSWLSDRSPQDSKISKLTISSYGGWFVMTEDKKFEWEGLPSPLTKLLESQKPGVELLVSLSLFEGLSYFVNCDYKAEWAFPSQTLAQTLRHAHTESEQLPETVTWISL